MKKLKWKLNRTPWLQMQGTKKNNWTLHSHHVERFEQLFDWTQVQWMCKKCLWLFKKNMICKLEFCFVGCSCNVTFPKLQSQDLHVNQDLFVNLFQNNTETKALSTSTLKEQQRITLISLSPNGAPNVFGICFCTVHTQTAHQTWQHSHLIWDIIFPANCALFCQCHFVTFVSFLKNKANDTHTTQNDLYMSCMKTCLEQIAHSDVIWFNFPSLFGLGDLFCSLEWPRQSFGCQARPWWLIPLLVMGHLAVSLRWGRVHNSFCAHNLFQTPAPLVKLLATCHKVHANECAHCSLESFCHFLFLCRHNFAPVLFNFFFHESSHWAWSQVWTPSYLCFVMWC